MPTVKSYDSKCYDLAEAFLSDEPALNNEALCHELALEIQQTIENFIAYEMNLLVSKNLDGMGNPLDGGPV